MSARHTLTGIMVSVEEETHHPTGTAGALSANVVTQSSILAGAALLTPRAMFARRTGVFTAECLGTGVGQKERGRGLSSNSGCGGHSNAFTESKYVQLLKGSMSEEGK